MEPMTCIECGQTMVVTREDLEHEIARGFRVLLRGVEVGRDANGHVARGIERAGPLLDAIVLTVLSKPSRLSGAEVRLLRTHAGWNGQEFAAIIGATPEQVSRWENDRNPIGPQADRLLRALVALRTGLGGFEVDVLRKIDDEARPPLELEARLVDGKWVVGAR